MLDLCSLNLKLGYWGREKDWHESNSVLILNKDKCILSDTYHIKAIFVILSLLARCSGCCFVVFSDAFAACVSRVSGLSLVFLVSTLSLLVRSRKLLWRTIRRLLVIAKEALHAVYRATLHGRRAQFYLYCILRVGFDRGLRLHGDLTDEYKRLIRLWEVSDAFCMEV